MIRVFNKPAPKGQIYFTDGVWVISHAIGLKEKLLACEDFEEYYDWKPMEYHMMHVFGQTESFMIENHTEQKTRLRPVVGETFFYHGDCGLCEVIKIEDGLIHFGIKDEDETLVLSEKCFEKEPNKYGALGVLYESKTVYDKEIEIRKHFNLFLDNFNDIKFNPSISQLKKAAEILEISLEDKKE